MRPMTIALLAMLQLPAICHSQDNRSSAAESRVLDQQAERAQLEYLKSLSDLAKSYEEAGNMEKAKTMLRSILTVNPDSDYAKDKLKAIEDSVFDKNETRFEIDSSKGWQPVGVVVRKDQPFRVEVNGTYKFMVTEIVNPDGFEGPAGSYEADLPVGAVIGMIIPPTPQGNSRRKNVEPPKTFLIGRGKEVKPEETGALLLRVNTPPAAKCVGKLDVTLKGNFLR